MESVRLEHENVTESVLVTPWDIIKEENMKILE